MQAVDAVSMAITLIESDDDCLPDHLEGDFSVDHAKPAVDILQQLLNCRSSIFYHQTGFTPDD